MYMDKYDENVKPVQITREYKEAIDIFPALHKYKQDHTAENLQKLCVEISEFCRAVYSSTQNDAERKIYRRMIEKLNR